MLSVILERCPMLQMGTCGSVRITDQRHEFAQLLTLIRLVLASSESPLLRLAEMLGIRSLQAGAA